MYQTGSGYYFFKKRSIIWNLFFIALFGIIWYFAEEYNVRFLAVNDKYSAAIDVPEEIQSQRLPLNTTKFPIVVDLGMVFGYIWIIFSW